MCIITHFQQHALDHQVTVKARKCVAVLMLIDYTNFMSLSVTYEQNDIGHMETLTIFRQV